MELFCHPNGNNNKGGRLKEELLLDTGTTSSINYLIFLEIAQMGQPVPLVRRKRKTKSSTGDIVPLVAALH